MAPSLAARIVETVARETQKDPRSLQPPLTEHVDTEALERALASGSLTGWVEFTAWDCTVRVNAETGAVSVVQSKREGANEQVADS